MESQSLTLSDSSPIGRVFTSFSDDGVDFIFNNWDFIIDKEYFEYKTGTVGAYLLLF